MERHSSEKFGENGVFKVSIYREARCNQNIILLLTPFAYGDGISHL
jgi:hypothetical protein